MKEKLSENYRIGNVTLNLSWTKCDMVIVVNNVVVGNTGHDYEKGYKLFAKVCKKNELPEWDIERFWGWKEFGGGLGTPEDNGYGKEF